MIEFEFKAGTKEPVQIKIAGIGGAGTNVLDRLVLDGIENADLIAFNTDAQSLTCSVAADKVQLGRQTTRGLGAGGDPEVGFLACEEASAEIAKAFEGAGMIFLCAGLGGGTGSGAAPLIAQIARDQGALVIVFATIPFVFEGKRRRQQAEEALLSLQEHADVVICFENEKMGDAVAPKAGIHQAFASADQTVSQSIRAICNLFNRPGLIRIGFDELCTVLRSQSSSCLFGYGEADGDNRAHDCLARALKNPLMDRGRLLADAQSVLVNVAGSPSMTLNEVNILMTELNRHVGDQTHILFGTAIDPKMGNRMSVTLVSSIGVAQPQWVRPRSPLAETAAPAPAPAIPQALPIREPQIQVAAVAKPEPELEPKPVLETPAEAPQIFAASESATPESQPLFTETIESIPFTPEPLPEPVSTEPEFLETTVEREEPVLVESEMPWDEPTQVAPQEELQPIEVTPSFLDFAEVQAEASQNETAAPESAAVLEEVAVPEEVAAAEPVAIPAPPAALPARIGPTIRTRAIGARAGELNLNIPINPAPGLPKSTEIKQETLQFEPVTRGRFEKSEPTIVDGQDLDVPTYLRRNVRIK